MDHLTKFELFENTSNNKMYHASPNNQHESILKNGLDPELGDKTWPDNEYPNGVYLVDDSGMAIKYAVIIRDDGDVWEVDTNGLEIHTDPECTIGTFFEGVNSYYTTNIINPDNIRPVDISDETKDSVWHQHEH